MDELNKLKDQWKDAKASVSKPDDATMEEFMKQAQKKKRNVLYAHYGNAAVLTVTLLMIGLFFYHITPFRDLISHIGVGLMMGGLLIRIIIELYSSQRSKLIQLTDQALTHVDQTVSFYQFRKKIHGPVTILIVALYTIGFYMLTPEFSKYLQLHWVILMDLSYVIGAIILVTQIRKGIRAEMKDLSELVEMRKEIASNDDA